MRLYEAQRLYVCRWHQRALTLLPMLWLWMLPWLCWKGWRHSLR